MEEKWDGGGGGCRRIAEEEDGGRGGWRRMEEEVDGGGEGWRRSGMEEGEDDEVPYLRY